MTKRRMEEIEAIGPKVGWAAKKESCYGCCCKGVRIAENLMNQAPFKLLSSKRSKLALNRNDGPKITWFAEMKLLLNIFAVPI